MMMEAKIRAMEERTLSQGKLKCLNAGNVQETNSLHCFQKDSSLSTCVRLLISRRIKYYAGVAPNNFVWGNWIQLKVGDSSSFLEHRRIWRNKKVNFSLSSIS